MIEKLYTDGEIYKDGEVKKLNLGTKEGKIVYVAPEKPNAIETIDCNGLTILPGIIDTQVHFRDPGASHKEDFATGSQAAALGGVTDLFDMPNTSPSTTDKEELRKKISMAYENASRTLAFLSARQKIIMMRLNELSEWKDFVG